MSLILVNFWKLRKKLYSCLNILIAGRATSCNQLDTETASACELRAGKDGWGLEWFPGSDVPSEIVKLSGQVLVERVRIICICNLGATRASLIAASRTHSISSAWVWRSGRASRSSKVYRITSGILWRSAIICRAFNYWPTLTTALPVFPPRSSTILARSTKPSPCSFTHFIPLRFPTPK